MTSDEYRILAIRVCAKSILDSCESLHWKMAGPPSMALNVLDVMKDTILKMAQEVERLASPGECPDMPEWPYKSQT